MQQHWIESFAEDLTFNKEFDLIIMTGNAFQALLTKDVMEKTFVNMKKALKPNGRILFESRNPNINWIKKWNYEEKLHTDSGTVTEKRILKSFENTIMKFDLEYHFNDEVITTNSQIKFWTSIEIQTAFEKANLSLVKLMGEWDKSPFQPESSLEMIFELTL